MALIALLLLAWVPGWGAPVSTSLSGEAARSAAATVPPAWREPVARFLSAPNADPGELLGKLAQPAAEGSAGAEEALGVAASLTALNDTLAASGVPEARRASLIAAAALARRRLPETAAPRLQARLAEVAASLPGALGDDALRAFLESRNDDFRGARPDLFLAKLRGAAHSEFEHFRAMPDLLYDLVRRSPQAGAIRATPTLWLDGDIHAKNVELVEHEGRLLPQFNDFDDTDLGPAGLDFARLFVGAAALGDGSPESRAELIAEARRAYARGLRQPFERWSREVAREAAVRTGPSVERHWRRHGGRILEDEKLAGKLFKLAGLNPDKWRLMDRAGAGLSSIGVRRYLFAHERRDHSRELKQLREAAPAAFTDHRSADQGARVRRGYELLRRSPVDVQAVSGLGAEWLLRRREGVQRSLNLDHPKSVARVLGGLTAQAHRGQAAPEALRRALGELTDETVLGWAQDMERMRAGLSRLLAAGTWKSRRAP